MFRTRLYWYVLACVSLVDSALCGSDAEQRLRDLVRARLTLSCNQESHSTKFQVEVTVRGVNERQQTVEQRIVLERNGDKVAALVLTPTGFPTSLLVGQTLLVIDGDKVKGFDGGRFHCQGGIIGDNYFGINVKYADDNLKSSTVAVDLNALANFFVGEESVYGWDARTKQLSVTTPSGAQLAFFLNDREDADTFPIRAAVATVTARHDPRVHISVGISNIYLGMPPRSLLKTTGWPELPIVGASFAELHATHLSDLGTSFDETNASARRLGTIMSDGFKLDKALRLSEQTRDRLHELLGSLGRAPEPKVRSSLHQIRGWGESHVWSHLQKPLGTPSAFRVDYDRFRAAAFTEIAMGPTITRELHDRLMDIVARGDLDDSIRCDAMDMIGYFGLPILSTRVDELAKLMPDEDALNSRVALACIRARQSLVTEADVQLLHQAVATSELPPSLRTMAIEALSISGELDRYESAPAPLLSDDLHTDNGAISRRVRAIAASPHGQRILLQLLESKDDRLALGDGLMSLLGSLTPSDENWGRLARFAVNTALNTEFADEVRITANKIVHQDKQLLESDYTDKFFRSTFGSQNGNLVYGALWNMLEVGRGAECYKHVQALLKSRQMPERSQATTLLSALSIVEWKSRKQLSSSFWPALDAVFQNDAASVQRVGPVLILMLIDEGVPVPVSYITPNVEIGLAAKNPADLAVSCFVVSRLSREDFALPIMREAPTKAAIIEWFNNNAETARRELELWHSKYEAGKLQIKDGGGER